MTRNRREFLRTLGLGAAAVPFVLNLPSLGFANQLRRKQRLVVMFSPDGVVPGAFWPDEEGDEFTLKESLSPLEPLQDRMLILHGVCDRVRGDGDTALRVSVYDESGYLVATATDGGSRLCLLNWTPRWTGTFTIRVTNEGPVYNHYTIDTN